MLATPRPRYIGTKKKLAKRGEMFSGRRFILWSLDASKRGQNELRRNNDLTISLPGAHLKRGLTSPFAGLEFDFELGQFDDGLLFELERMKHVAGLARGEDENAAVRVKNEPIHVQIDHLRKNIDETPSKMA